MFVPGYEWQSVALFLVVGAYAAWQLWRWHTHPKFEGFNLIDLVAEDGRISARKFMEFGAFVVSTQIMVMAGVRGTVSDTLLLAYCGTFAGARVAGQVVHAMGQRAAAAAQPARPRMLDDDTPADAPRKGAP